MFYRELGFGLEEINAILRDPCYDRAGALRHQRDLLVVRRDRLQTMIGAVQTALDGHEKGITMTKEEMFEVFGDFDPKAYEAEVDERWAGPALEQSKRRTKTYGKDQWGEAIGDVREIGHTRKPSPARGVAAFRDTHGLRPQGHLTRSGGGVGQLRGSEGRRAGRGG